MDSRFKVCASVAAVPLVAKPGYIVSEMWRQVTRGAKDIFGRAKPLLLVGSGALQWGKTNINTRLAKAVGVFVESNQNLVNTHTVRKWKYWRNVVDSRFRTGPENSQVLAIPPENIDDGVKDTVGVVVGDGAGNQVVLTSSGGITLKTSGRVGPAALLGSGISIEVLNLPFGKRSKTECDDSVATHDGLISRTLGTCTTGFGEDIITLQYASRCSRQLLERDEDEMAMDVLEDVYRSCAKNKDDKSPYYLQSDPLYLGVIAVDSSQYDDGLVRNTVVYGHSTETMILASQHASDERCRVTVSCNSTVGNWKSGEFTIG
ncbi:N-terminal nucleophile aminohydrolase [Nadsonia fulvescens var. elongata DSM 6958]|uniref:N-terminal nucleophile aminohydrolase n=1 Tax=Nadsonia fulvescens var. elongata DSM 6958 TaxID=857566 RepID=A0A1E3PF46_9ASCO|nr:N-terminal nucleophile aminohydrolase [Nadsonia fulvescens var. elongata DSM 6958]